KIGGSTLTEGEKRRTILEDVALMRFVGIRSVIVHGGGKEINQLTEKLGKKVRFVDGLRHTDDESIGIVKMVLGKINSEVVGELENIDCKAIGITGKSGKLIMAKRKEALGFVGEIKAINTKVLLDLMEDGYTPVVQPIGMDEKGMAVNINADEAASAIAKALKAEKLIFLTNVPGLLEDEKDEKSLISLVTTHELKQKLKWSEIGGGMIPKTRGIIEAVESGVKSVHIIDGRKDHALLLEIFTDRGIGTMVVE
ncbi:MAG: acetylglutamate kinase, partial [Candidatus Altiarchaeota archaeon]|nr:acetylglutamate kinase [Candidatus Altiarchaeota archaeon]